MEKYNIALKKVARDISRYISDKTIIGLGSGSTIALLLEELANILSTEGKKISGVPTSIQIENVAERLGISTMNLSAPINMVIDGADQVDRELNLIKGGGGALLKEKIVMKSCTNRFIVASKDKFVDKLCEMGAKVPVEVLPFARKIVKKELEDIGGIVEERMLSKGYPYITENGNIIMDVQFNPIEAPRELELTIKSIPGVIEVGIFTLKPISVYKVEEEGFRLLKLT